MHCHRNSDGKGWAGQATGEQVSSRKGPPVKTIHIGAAHIPVGAIEAQRGGKIRFDFDQRIVPKPGLFKTESLASSASAKFD